MSHVIQLLVLGIWTTYVMVWYVLSYSYWHITNTFWYFSSLVILSCCFNNLTAGGERFERMLWTEECNSCGYVSSYSSYWVCLLIGAVLIFSFGQVKPTGRFSTAFHFVLIFDDNNATYILCLFINNFVPCFRNVIDAFVGRQYRRRPRPSRG